MSIKVKRVYEAARRDDGKRFLVERLWPRGIKKEALKMKAWLKDLGASNELRKWFSHDPQKWAEFRRRYFEELKTKPDLVKTIRDESTRGNVTLLYSAKDTEHNNAAALKEFIEKKK